MHFASEKREAVKDHVTTTKWWCQGTSSYSKASALSSSSWKKMGERGEIIIPEDSTAMSNNMSLMGFILLLAREGRRNDGPQRAGPDNDRRDRNRKMSSDLKSRCTMCV